MTLGSLAGSRVRRVDRPAEDLLVLTLAGREAREALVLRLAGRERGIGLVPERPRTTGPRAGLDTLRALLENARLEGVRCSADGEQAVVMLRRAERRMELRLRARARGGAVELVDASGELLAALAVGAAAGEEPRRETLAGAALDALRARGPSLVGAALQDGRERERAALRRALGRAIDKLERRLDAIAEDERRAEAAAALRADAALILANLHRYAKGAASLSALDHATDPPVERSIAIDPRKGAKGRADELYRTAKRLERGAELARARRLSTRVEAARLEALRDRVDAAEDLEAIAAFAEEAGALGVRGARAAVARGAAKPAVRVPYRRFLGAAGKPILVGRSADDNAALTFQVARPHDLWLHARADRGAHVIVPLDRGQSCPADLLVDAATLAAHFSAARGESVVEVQLAERRHLRRRRGAPPGTVHVDRERVMAVRLEPTRLERLLANERFDG